MNPTIKILAIDDDPVDLEILRHLIAQSNRKEFNLICVSDIFDALLTLTREPIDLIILDYRLGPETAVDFIKVLDKSRSISRPPIIVYTGSDSIEIAIHAFRSGVSDFFLKKELRSEQLIEAIDRVLLAEYQLLKVEENLTDLLHITREDDVTGLNNRNWFMIRLKEEIHRCRRYGMNLSLMFLNIDCLRNARDEYGQATVDNILGQLGRAIRQVIRDVDIPGRLGSEEFALVLPHTSGQTAMNVGRRIMEKVTSQPFSSGHEMPIALGCNIGMAELAFSDSNGQGNNKEICSKLLTAADRAMQESKRMGRNKIQLAHSNCGYLV